MTISTSSLFAQSFGLLESLSAEAGTRTEILERAQSLLQNTDLSPLSLSGDERRRIQNATPEPEREDEFLRTFALFSAALGEQAESARSQTPPGPGAVDIIDGFIESRSDGIFIVPPEFGFIARSDSFPYDYPPFRTSRGTEVVLHDGAGDTSGLGWIYFRNPKSSLRGMIYFRGLGRSFSSRSTPLWQAAGETRVTASAIPMRQARLELMRRGHSMNLAWRLVDVFLDWMDSDYRTGLAGSAATLMIPSTGKRPEAWKDYGELLNVLGCHLTWCPDNIPANDAVAQVAPYRVFGSPKSGRRSASPSHFESTLVADLLRHHRTEGSLLLDGFAEGTEMLELRLLQDQQHIAGTVVRHPESLRRALADPKARDFRLILEEKEPSSAWTRLRRRWGGLRTAAGLSDICSQNARIHAFVPTEGPDCVNYATARGLLSGGIRLIAGTADLPFLSDEWGATETLETLLEAGGIKMTPDFAIRSMGALAAVYHSMLTVKHSKETALPALSELPSFFSSYLKEWDHRDLTAIAQAAWREEVSANLMKGPKF